MPVVIDTESDPGSYADALRFPNSITVIDGGTGRSKPAVTPAGNDPPPPAGVPLQRHPGSALNEAPAMVCTELPIAGADVSLHDLGDG